MYLFETQTENKQEELIWQSDKNAKTPDIIWPAARLFSLAGDFGDMSFQWVRTDNFGLWANFYKILAGRWFKSRLDYCSVELNLVIQNEFTYKQTPFSSTHVREMQFNLSHTPYMENVVKLDAGQTYKTFDLHINPLFLAKIARSYPYQLNIFLDQVIKKQFAMLYPEPQPASQFLTGLFNIIMFRLQENSFDKPTLDAYGEAFIRTAIEQGELIMTKGPASKEIFIEKQINRVKSYILFNLNKHQYLTIARLMKIAAMNRTDLEFWFKANTGETITQYIRSYRLQWAKDLLRYQPNYSIGRISDELGYANIQGFSRFFSKALNIDPRSFRKISFNVRSDRKHPPNLRKLY